MKAECHELKSYYHYRGGVTGRSRIFTLRRRRLKLSH